jgi:hypothetical protein
MQKTRHSSLQVKRCPWNKASSLTFGIGNLARTMPIENNLISHRRMTDKPSVKNNPATGLP